MSWHLFFVLQTSKSLFLASWHFFLQKTCLWPVQGWFPACTLLLEQAVNMGSQGPKEPKEKLEINELTCFFCTPNFTELVLGSRHFFLQKPVYGPPKAGFLHAPCSWNRRSTWGAKGRRNQKRSLKSMSWQVFFCKSLFMARPKMISCMHPAFGTGCWNRGAMGRRNHKTNIAHTGSIGGCWNWLGPPQSCVFIFFPFLGSFNLKFHMQAGNS